ncbi:hypothetical protein RUND412_010652, partial [Rhizina undulata]
SYRSRDSVGARNSKGARDFKDLDTLKEPHCEGLCGSWRLEGAGDSGAGDSE